MLCCMGATCIPYDTNNYSVLHAPIYREERCSSVSLLCEPICDVPGNVRVQYHHYAIGCSIEAMSRWVFKMGYALKQQEYLCM